MEKLSVNDIEEIKSQHGDVPGEYLDWLVHQGWGEQLSGIMLYSRPIDSSDIIGDEHKESLKEVLLIGDDMSGYFIGYRKIASEWSFVGFDSALGKIDMIDEGLKAYLES